MKRKTINAIITKKMKEWQNSIEDEAVRELVRKNTIVTGGCIASMLLGEKVNDFDVYFRNKETALEVAKYYVKRFKIKDKEGIDCPITIQHNEDRVGIVIKSSGIVSEEGTGESYEYFEMGGDRGDQNGHAYASEITRNLNYADSGEIEDIYDEANDLAQDVEDDSFRAVFMSTNAITLSNKVQIVLRFFGEPGEIHENYDFVHCTNYWTSLDTKVVLKSDALEALLNRELVYVGSKYPLCSIIRTRKFIKRGWTINAGQYLKMCLQLNDMDLKNVEVLREQTTGVDSAYFTDMLQRIENANGAGAPIDAAYLIEVIDRIF